MKKLLSILAVTAVIGLILASCKNHNQILGEKYNSIKYEDTVGFAQFQQWKAMNERLDPSQYQPYAPAQAPVAYSTHKPARRYSNGRMSSSSSNYARTTTRKRGWSKAAKYTAIGGGTGVVLGAVINKRNRLAGGLVGGVLLGGAGYLLGHSQDKREGRY
jgi:hypothetical protein